MATTKSRASRSRTTKAKTTPTPEEAEETETTPEAEEIEEEIEEGEEEAPAEATTPRAPSQPTYRADSDFSPALKSAKSAAKGNTDLLQALRLITHLSWKTPGGSVGWARGTTADVISYADDIAVPAGTPVTEAMEAALHAASSAATEKPQKDALAVLAKVIKNAG